MCDNNVMTANLLEAVYVRGAEKSYGIGKKRTKILSKFDMNVKKGVIYGLFGASGCGKTTLLSCLVGRRSLDSGEMLLFGCDPTSPECGIPGPLVGYMPQQLALYGDFTISETLQFFGRLYKMEQSLVRSRMDFLIKLFDLPSDKRAIKTLSAGLQRCVSYAASIFHDPELMILDEPMVGVDLELRRKIWDHLIYLSNEHHKTIIITTQYIEDVRHAHAIGLMRFGRLLVEESPHDLLTLHGLPSLDEVFLKLIKNISDSDMKQPVVYTSSDNTDIYPSRSFDNPVFKCDSAGSVSIPLENCDDISKGGVQHQKVSSEFANTNVANRSDRCAETPKWKDIVSKQDSIGSITSGTHLCKTNSNCSTSTSTSTSTSASTITQDARAYKERRRKMIALTFPTLHRTCALMRKNALQMFRRFVLFLFFFLLPVLQCIMFCVAIGNPKLIKIAIVNDELEATETKVCPYITDCTLSMFSCRFVRYLSNHTFVPVHYASYEEASADAQNGHVHGMVRIPQNFTSEFVVRQSMANDADIDTIIGSQINVNLDWSSQQIGATLQFSLLEAFENFAKDLSKACGSEEAAASIPLAFSKPIYGNRGSSITEFMAPGVILTVLFFISAAMTGSLFISERKKGLLDRSLVAGASMIEILLANLINQFIVLLGQTALVFVFVSVVFEIPCLGSAALAVCLAVLQGLVGICYGLLLSAVFDEFGACFQLTMGTFFSTLLLSGVVWPLEGMPVFLCYVSYFLPQTIPIEALRSIFVKGLDFERAEVYHGFSVSLAWIILQVLLTIFFFRIRRYSA